MAFSAAQIAIGIALAIAERSDSAKSSKDPIGRLLAKVTQTMRFLAMRGWSTLHIESFKQREKVQPKTRGVIASAASGLGCTAARRGRQGH